MFFSWRGRVGGSLCLLGNIVELSGRAFRGSPKVSVRPLPPWKRRGVVLAVAILLVVLGTGLGYALYQELTFTEEIRVVHAGSLSVPFKRVEQELLAENPKLRLIDEAYGSVDAVRQVTDLGRSFDVVGTADYQVIKSLMLPQYADWFIVFARNEMVLIYTNTSRYAGEMARNQTVWYEILKRPDLRVGVADPQRDPSGYRAVMLLKLASLYYGEDVYRGIYEDKQNAGSLLIKPKETELLSFLEVGEIDYLISYLSLAVQHNLEYFKLPKPINLGDPDHATYYRQVKVKIGEVEIEGIPILYGVTIPRDSPNRPMAIRFLQLLLSEKGRSIMESSGQPPVHPALVGGDLASLPGEINPQLVERDL